MQTYNLALGRHYLQSTFNITSVPVAWELDSFGYSALTPAVFTRFGYRYLVVNRVDAEMKMYLRHRSSAEFLWETGAVGSNSKILTHVLSRHYDLPLFINPYSREYCFKNSTIDQCARRFVEQMQVYAQSSNSRRALLLYGGDFAFAPQDQRSLLFAALELLLAYFRDSTVYQNVKVVLATPSEYFDSQYFVDRQFPVYSGEMLPYLMNREFPQYWTGFYTTRPNLKKEIRRATSAVRAAQLLSALVLRKEYWDSALAEGLHHDAIAGTLRPLVAEGLLHSMRAVSVRATRQVQVAVREMLPSSETRRSGAALVFVNPLNWQRDEVVSVSHSHPFVEIQSPSDETVASQYLYNSTDDSYAIYFQVSMPSLSCVVYFLVEREAECIQCAVPSERVTTGQLEGGEYTLTFTENGFLGAVEHKQHGLYAFRRTEFKRYSTLESGAYVFKPTSKSTAFDSFHLLENSQWTGPVVSLSLTVWEVSSNVTFSQIVKLPRHSIGHFSVSLTTFALDSEVMLEIEPAEVSDSPWFHTFSDGELRQRVFFDPVFSARSGKNFMPVSTALVLGKVDFALMLFPDYVLGAGMVSKRVCALHLHRSTTEDDGNGLESGAIDNSPSTHEFRISLGPVSDSVLWRHSLEQFSPLISWAGGVDWRSSTAAAVEYTNEAAYLQSIEHTGGRSLARVLNLRAGRTDFAFTGFEEKTGLSGISLPAPQFNSSVTTLCFETCANGAAVPILRAVGDSQGTELHAYEYAGFWGQVPANIVSQIHWRPNERPRSEQYTMQYSKITAELERPPDDTGPVFLTGRPYDFMSHEPLKPRVQVVPSPVSEEADYLVLTLLEVLFVVLAVLLSVLICRRRARRKVTT